MGRTEAREKDCEARPSLSENRSIKDVIRIKSWKDPKPIRSILENALRGLEIDAHLKTYSIWGAWKEIVGESVALHARPHAIRNRILFVHVSHPTWVQQLQFLKSALIDKINAFLGEPLVRDIRFHLGKIESEASPRQKKRDVAVSETGRGNIEANREPAPKHTQ